MLSSLLKVLKAAVAVLVVAASVIFSDHANVEVIDDGLHGSQETICHGCQASSACDNFMIYQEGHFYFVEKWGWHVKSWKISIIAVCGAMSWSRPAPNGPSPSRT